MNGSNATRDPDTILAAWLDEGPLDLPAETRRAIAAALPTTPQARRGLLAPWRFSNMNSLTRLATVAALAILAIGGTLYVLSPGSSVGPPGPSISPSPSPTIDASLPNAGTITLTEIGCAWQGNPGTLKNEDVVMINLRNETNDFADFQLHWVRSGHTYEEGVAYVSEIARRLTTGEEWPPNDISVGVHAQGVAAGSQTITQWPTAGPGEAPAPEVRASLGWRLETGTYGVVCSANTSPTGDVLSTFLVGPLELDFRLP